MVACFAICRLAAKAWWRHCFQIWASARETFKTNLVPFFKFSEFDTLVSKHSISMCHENLNFSLLLFLQTVCIDEYCLRSDISSLCSRITIWQKQRFCLVSKPFSIFSVSGIFPEDVILWKIEVIHYLLAGRRNREQEERMLPTTCF